MTHDPQNNSDAPPRVRDLLARGASRLRQGRSETPELDAAVLLGHVLNLNRAALYARGLEPVPTEAAGAFDAAIERRASGEPVAYITGMKEFMGLPFALTTATLVPRPETELLVEWAIAWLARRDTPAMVVDVGTGSGAIGVSIARLARAAVTASDVSLTALRVARENASTNGVRARVAFVCGDMLRWLGRPVSLILANLPYLTGIQATDARLSAEPRIALAGGDEDGFQMYRRLIPQVARRLLPGGAFAFEIDPAQAEIARAECIAAFAGARVIVHRDLAGLDRFVTVETPS